MSQEMTTISPADFNEFVKHSFGRIGAKITDFLWMAEHHGKSSLEIADGIGFHVEIVERYLKVLENDGFVKRIATLSTNPVYAIEFEGLLQKMKLTAAFKLEKLKEVQHLANEISRRNRERVD